MNVVDIKRLLENSGWNEKRKVNVNETVSLLQSEGYIINNNQMEFLKQYEGLEIEFDNPRLPSTKETLKMKPKEASAIVFRSLVEEYEKYCGTAFLIVGEIEQENMTVYMDNKGDFYGGYDDCLIKLGSDFEKSLFNLVNGIKLKVMYID